MIDRVNLRHSLSERDNLAAIAAAIHTSRAQAASWRPVTNSEAIRPALAVGAEAAGTGNLPAA